MSLVLTGYLEKFSVYYINCSILTVKLWKNVPQFKKQNRASGGIFFFGTLLLLLVLKEKKNIHSECEISFLCGGRQHGSQCPSWLRRCGPAWHLGANAAKRWQVDSAVVVALRQGHQTQMNSQSLLFWLRFVYKPECRRLLCTHGYSRVLPRGCGHLGTLKQALWIGSYGPKDTEMARWVPYCKRWSHLETKRLRGRRILLSSSLPAPSVKRETLCPTLDRGLTEACLQWEGNGDCISQISFELCPSETS